MNGHTEGPPHAVSAFFNAPAPEALRSLPVVLLAALCARARPPYLGIIPDYLYSVGLSDFAV